MKRLLPLMLLLFAIPSAMLAAEGGFTSSGGPPAPPAVSDSDPVLAYFDEIVLHSEYGSSERGVVHKWTRDVAIEVFGDYTPQDMDALRAVLRDLNELLNPALDLRLVDVNGDMAVHFMPMDRFAELEPVYGPGNEGCFSLRWDRNGAIFTARVLIDTSRVTQIRRNHLLREEITQALGPMNDSWRYPDSIFYQGVSDTQSYADIDEQLIRLLYDPAVRPGMSLDQVRAIRSRTSEAPAGRPSGRPRNDFELIVH